MPRCIACRKIAKYAEVVLINVRNKGKIIDRQYVHPACYEKDPDWVQRQVKGKNPKYFVY